MEGQPHKHLLIVDDEPVILQILKAVFEDEPVRLTCRQWDGCASCSG